MIRQYFANRAAAVNSYNRATARLRTAQRKLSDMTAESARSPETISYRINRARGKLSWRTRRERCA